MKIRTPNCFENLCQAGLPKRRPFNACMHVYMKHHLMQNMSTFEDPLEILVAT